MGTVPHLVVNLCIKLNFFSSLCSGKTPLHYAVVISKYQKLEGKKDHFEIFRFIFEQADDKNPADWKGLTPLDVANFYGHEEISNFISKNVGNR